MLTISVEFLHGTFRATGAEDTAITGQPVQGEWPPSPARLFSALVAADGTRDRCSVTDGSELRQLERARPPRILACRYGDVLVSDQLERYVVVDEGKGERVQEYVWRTSTVVRPGARLAPRFRTVSYVWDDFTPEPRALTAITARAARIGYLGCADSPVRVAVGTSAPTGDDWWVPSEAGDRVVPVPYAGFVDNLDAAYTSFCAGQPQRRSWVPNRYTRYRSPSDPHLSDPRPMAVWARFEKAVSGRRLLHVTEALRSAVLERYLELVEGNATAVPSVLTGHGFEGKGYDHAYFVALPDVGHRNARGTLHGAAVVLPAGTAASIVEAVRNCLWRTRVLGRRDIFQTAMSLYGGEQRPAAATPSRWSLRSRRWVSATPVVHERFARNGPTLDEISRWCEHAGLRNARPLQCRTVKIPLLPGALCLAPPEVYREGKERRPYSHLEILFDRPVQGPVVLGRGRQFGLGLMFPVAAKEGADD